MFDSSNVLFTWKRAAGQARRNGKPQRGRAVHDDVPVAVPQCQTATERSAATQGQSEQVNH